MHRFVASALLGAFVVLSIPGFAEAIENVAHMVQEGHGAHAANTSDQHEEPDAEHGCTTVFHLCSCHVSASPLMSRSPNAAVTLSPALRADVARSRDKRPGFVRSIDHPPRS